MEAKEELGTFQLPSLLLWNRRKRKRKPSFYNPPSFLGKKKQKKRVPSIPFISFVIL
jgi:hypothetical protein